MKIIKFLKSKLFDLPTPPPVKIEIRDKNKITPPDDLLNEFRLVADEDEAKILSFLNSYTAPSEELIEFSKSRNIAIMNQKTYERAVMFKNFKDKYKYRVVSKNTIERFTKKMYKEYNLNFRLDILTSDFKLEPQTIEAMLEASKLIDPKDGALHLKYEGDYYNAGPIRMKREIDMTVSEFGLLREPNEIDLKAVESVYGSTRFKITHIMHGAFYILHENVDPFILASLKDDMFLLISHIHTMPIPVGILV